MTARQGSRVPTPEVPRPQTRRALRNTWERSELAPVSSRPPLRVYLTQLWARRHFIRMQAFSQAMGQNQGTLLGNAWLILSPLMDGLVYWFIFGVVFGARHGVPDFVPRLIIGILLFSFVGRCLTSSAGSVRAGRGLIRAFPFPRASLPVAAIMREVFTQIPAFFTMLVLILLVPPRSRPSSTWLLAPLPFLLMAATVAGIGLVLARCGNSLPDVSKLIRPSMRILMYASGVIFAVDRFGAHPTVMKIIAVNPVFQYIEMTRSLLLYDSIPPPQNWLVLVAWALSSLFFGIVFFWRGEPGYGRERFN